MQSVGQDSSQASPAGYWHERQGQIVVVGFRESDRSSWMESWRDSCDER